MKINAITLSFYYSNHVHFFAIKEKKIQIKKKGSENRKANAN